MAEQDMTSAVVFTSRFTAVASALVTAQTRALAEAGRRIAAEAQAHMVPGYFYETGASKEQTAYHQVSRTTGEVRIDTPYAGYVELGTSRMAAHPVLRPAVDTVWPELPAIARFACSAMEGIRLGQALPDTPPVGEDALG